MTTSDDGRDVEKLDHSYVAGECVNWHSHSGKKVWQFLKLSMWLPSCSPATVLWAFTTQKWKFVFMWYLDTNLYRSFVCILQKLETIQIPFKMCHVHTMDYYSAWKGMNYWWMQQPGSILREWYQKKKPNAKGNTQYDCSNRMVLIWQNF